LVFDSVRGGFEAPDGPSSKGIIPTLSATDAEGADTAERFRHFTSWLVVAAIAVALLLDLGLRTPIDPEGTVVIDWLIASLLLVSRIWWARRGHQRIADALGTVALAALGGMACGAIAMLELQLHFPIADSMLKSWDHALGIDGIAIVRWQLHDGNWLFPLMRLAYNNSFKIFFGGLVLISLLGNRIEAWRATFCFVGTLFTTCMIAIFVPAKGLATWASPDVMAALPPHAMRNFWPHFDEFYFGDHPVLRLQVIDGVISFPSFHSIAGFLTVAMWRKNIVTRLAALSYCGVMLLATLPGGGHYVVDLLGGFLVWLAWFLLSLRVEAGTRQPLKACG